MVCQESKTEMDGWEHLVTEFDSVPRSAELVDIGAQPRHFSLEPEYPGYKVFVDLSPAICPSQTQ